MKISLKKNNIILTCVAIITIFIAAFSIFFYIKNHNVEKVHFLKEWTIYFDKEMNEDEVKDKKIYVLDENDKKVQCNLILGKYGKSIKVMPPKGGYIQGNTYFLDVKNENKAAIEKIYGNNKKSLKFKIYKEKNQNKVAQFRDKNLEQLIRREINKPSGEILVNDVNHVTSLVLTFNSIRDITGLEYFTNLHQLVLDGNQIENIKPLKNLTDIEYLGLSANKIKTVKYLKNMKFLNGLFLNRNKINSYDAIKKIYKNLENKDFEIK